MIYLVEWFDAVTGNANILGVADSLGAALSLVKRPTIPSFSTTWGPLKRVRVYGSFHYEIEGSMFCPARGRYVRAETAPVKYTIRMFNVDSGEYQEPEFIDEIRAKHEVKFYTPDKCRLDPPRALPEGYKFIPEFHS